ncbi:MAG: RecQ family ATP-dependent DNA helicase [Planctomycetota bacterium]|nr:RecQ family ATP-dependent DNA helicase [Planctomycetota bacterium]
MDERILATLSERFGFSEFRPGQDRVIEHLVAGRSSAAVFPTGGGKSLCYQLPALLLPGLTLVVSPLIALMKDQIDSLRARNINAARLDSSLTLDEYREVTQQARRGELKLLYVAPERFTNERFRELLAQVNVSLFAVDEAHCISEWGHNFRPDYLKLARFATECRADSVLALTATATPQVMEDMCRFFEIAPECAVRTPFYRSNLTLLGQPVAKSQRDSLLLQQLQSRERGPVIVYVTLQKTAERVAAFLASKGWPARAYHAGMDADPRSQVQDWFMASEDAIVVATIAFGMGIDKSNIRYVYHYNLPKSLENYSQEIGRAGRDGLTSICHMLFCTDDLSVLENFILGDTPDYESVASLVQELFAQGDELVVSQYSLSSRHDIRPLVVRTLITYLETSGYLDETTPIYSSYKFQPLTSSAEILSRFEGERREFLHNVFRCATKARTWFTIDLEVAAKRSGSDRGRIIRAFDYLVEQGLLELRPSGLMHRYRRIKMPESLADVAKDLHQRMVHREKRDLERLNEVVRLVTDPGCQVSRLSAHFGEPLDSDCGHCSHCLNAGVVATIPGRPASTIDEGIWQQAQAVRREHAAALASPNRFARFLCGISSPRLTQAKLSRHDLFGVFEAIPFVHVRERAEQQPIAPATPDF